MSLFVDASSDSVLRVDLLDFAVRRLGLVLALLRVGLLLLEGCGLALQLLVQHAELVDHLVVGVGGGLAVLGARPELLHVGGVDAERVAAPGAHVQTCGASAEPATQSRRLRLGRFDALLGRR